jgi:hypothetical protein
VRGHLRFGGREPAQRVAAVQISCALVSTSNMGAKYALPSSAKQSNARVLLRANALDSRKTC